MVESTIGPTTPVELVEQVYTRYPERVATARSRLGRPLTFAEKVLFAHADDAETIGLAAASTTPTTGPTASRCRTRPRRWRCCSS